MASGIRHPAQAPTSLQLPAATSPLSCVLQFCISTGTRSLMVLILPTIYNLVRKQPTTAVPSASRVLLEHRHCSARRLALKECLVHFQGFAVHRDRLDSSNTVEVIPLSMSTIEGQSITNSGNTSSAMTSCTVQNMHTPRETDSRTNVHSGVFALRLQWLVSHLLGLCNNRLIDL